MACHRLVYLWRGINPFLPIPYHQTVEARSIARLELFVNRITPDIDLDIQRAEQNREYFARLVELATRIQDHVLQDKAEINKEEDTAMENKNQWQQVVAKLWRLESEVLKMEGDLATLQDILPISRNAEEYYRLKRIELTGIKHGYAGLIRRLNLAPFHHNIEQGRRTLGLSNDADELPLNTVIEAKDIVEGIKRGAEALQCTRNNWEASQVDHSNELFGLHADGGTGTRGGWVQHEGKWLYAIHGRLMGGIDDVGLGGYLDLIA